MRRRRPTRSHTDCTRALTDSSPVVQVFSWRICAWRRCAAGTDQLLPQQVLQPWMGPRRLNILALHSVSNAIPHLHRSNGPPGETFAETQSGRTALLDHQGQDCSLESSTFSRCCSCTIRLRRRRRMPGCMLTTCESLWLNTFIAACPTSAQRWASRLAVQRIATGSSHRAMQSCLCTQQHVNNCRRNFSSRPVASEWITSSATLSWTRNRARPCCSKSSNIRPMRSSKINECRSILVATVNRLMFVAKQLAPARPRFVRRH